MIKNMISLAKKIVKKYEKNNHKLLNNSMKNLLLDERIVLLDIGAAGDIQPRWKKISSLINYIGFEPDKRSYEQLLQQKNFCSKFKIINSAVWEFEGDLSINFCKKPMVSSHFYPNFDFLNRFSDSTRFEVISKVSVPAKKLDDHNITEIDFAKLDIQGGELAALKGGTSLLKDCLGLEVEVSFISQYTGQPLFGEVSNFLSLNEFEFIDFVHLNRWERKSFNDFGQLVWGDALFLKTPETVFEKYKSDNGKIKKYIAICAIYGKFDFIDALEEKLNFDKYLSKPLALHRNRYYSNRRRLSMINKILRFVKLEMNSYLVN